MASSRLVSLLLLIGIFGCCFADHDHKSGGNHGSSGGSAILNKLTQQKAITDLQGNNQELNPYGLAAITFNKGELRAGNFLATQWNDVNNNPGQGHTILQVTPQGQFTPFATIDTNSPLIQNNCGTQGVGLTMALVILSRGYVVVGSTPIPVGSTIAGPGCLILLDANGNVLDAHQANELTSSNTMTGGGPWGMAVQESSDGSSASLFVSYVLGSQPTSTTTLTGAQGGMVVRYSLGIPSSWSQGYGPQFWGPQPDVIAAGFPTQPGNIGAGAVGPSGLFVGKKTGAYKEDLEKSPLFISNLLANTINVVKKSTQCKINSGKTPCKLQVVASGGNLNQPIGIQQTPLGTIVGANGGAGTLFEIAPTVGANKQLATKQVDTTGGNGAGALFTVLFHPKHPNLLFFNDDATNTYNTLSGRSSSGRKTML